MGIRVKSSSFKGTDKWSWFQITRKSIQTPTDKEKKSERDKLFPTWFFNTTWGKNAERQQQVCPVCITTHYQVLMVKHQFLDPYCALQLPWQPLSSCDTAESPPNTTAHQPPKPLNSLIIWTLKTAPITTWLQAKIHCQMSCLGEMPTNITWTSFLKIYQTGCILYLPIMNMELLEQIVSDVFLHKLAQVVCVAGEGKWISRDQHFQ